MNIKERIFKLNKRGTFCPPGFWYLTGLMKVRNLKTDRLLEERYDATDLHIFK